MPRVKKFFKCSFFFVLVQKACTLVPEVKLFQTCLCGAADCCAFQVAAAGGVLQGQSPGGGGYSTWAVHNPAARSAWHHPRACDALPPSSSELSDTWEAVSFSIPSGPRLHNGVMGAGGHC